MFDAKEMKTILILIAENFIDREEELCKLDSTIGDGDHGITMARGSKAAMEKIKTLPEETSCSDYLKIYGRTMTSTLGGASGPLFGSIFIELSRACKNEDGLSKESYVDGIERAYNKIQSLGGAKPGDKTMVDCIYPIVENKDKIMSIEDESELLNEVVRYAHEGLESTKGMMANRGRAKYVREKSLGCQDAGSTSFYYIVKTIADYHSNK